MCNKSNYDVLSEISDLSTYLQLINDITKQWFPQRELVYNSTIWFRGQSDDYKLFPKVLRKTKLYKSEREYNERKICVSFDSHYKNYTDIRFDDVIEKLAFMQHYDIPTRLLDWTEMPITALYFAIKKYEDNEINTENPIVWILNVGKLNEATFEKETNGPVMADNDLIQIRAKMIGYIEHEQIKDQFFEKNKNFVRKHNNYYKYPIAFYPVSSGNIRISSQKGMFTIHGIDNISVDDFMNNKKLNDGLLKICINKNKIKNLLIDLNDLGISPRSIYPDLNGFAQELCSIRYRE